MNNDLKKFIGTLLKFIPVAALLYLVLLCFWGELMPDFLKKNLSYRTPSPGFVKTRLEEVKTVKDVDVLILGSSHAYRGFDTRFFEAAGYKAFNLGTSAQTPAQTKMLLNRYLDRLNPKLVVYEVYPLTFSIDGVEASLDVIANDRNDWHSIEMAVASGHIKTLNTLVYGLYRDLAGRNQNVKEPKQVKGDTYIPGGYVERASTAPAHKPYKAQKWNLDAGQFESFEEILAMLKERNIEVVLVNAPTSPSLYQSYTNNAEFDSIMTGYGKYYNFNEMLKLDDTQHFYDDNHLNKAGVQVFNEKLLETALPKK